MPSAAVETCPSVVLTIAGSEATGGPGAQADMKTFQELGVFGIANLTCIVSFNPNDNWNHRFVPVDQQVIADQLEATTAAYGAASGAPSVLDTVKIGMLGSPATIGTVSAALASGVSGAGCSLAAAVTAELAKGATPLEAARTAKAFVTAGIRNRVASGAPFDALWEGGPR